MIHWGSTQAERARSLPGDAYLTRKPCVRMTRGISIAAPPEKVWPWIAQAGRGAGWYSYDWIDNGRKESARHIVSWIPPPRLGDATAIGYLRELTDHSMVWWLDGLNFFGAEARLVVYYGVEPEGDGTRFIARMSADARGWSARLALLLFVLMDTIMARKQVLGIRERAEAESVFDETGARDQYQLYEVLYADGGAAGVRGREHSARWRRKALEDGVLRARESA
ncbi:MAG: SRPBCC family protein [Planctomycetota bacterium]